MQKITWTLLVLVLLAACSGVPDSKPVEKYTIEQFYKNKSIGGGQFNSEGTKLLVSSNETGIYNVYTLPVDGTAPTQLTNSTVESNFAVSFIPNSEKFIFSADKGGNENSHLYLNDGNGNTKDLTPNENSSNSFFGWAKDKQSFFYGSNKRDPRFFDIYEMNIAELEKENPVSQMF